MVYVVSIPLLLATVIVSAVMAYRYGVFKYGKRRRNEAIFVLGSLVLLVVVLAGCGGSSVTGKSVGKYKAVGASTENIKEIELKSDGTFLLTPNHGQQSYGPYEVKGGYVILDWGSGNKSRYQIQRDILLFSDGKPAFEKMK